MKKVKTIDYPRSRFTPADFEHVKARFGVDTVWICRENGADALAFLPDDGIFRVAANSLVAPMCDFGDTLVETCREFAAPAGRDPTAAFELPVDTPMPDASTAAWFVCGCPCDETVWTALDGSHPIVRKQSE